MLNMRQMPKTAKGAIPDSATHAVTVGTLWRVPNGSALHVVGRKPNGSLLVRDEKNNVTTMTSDHLMASHKPWGAKADKFPLGTTGSPLAHPSVVMKVVGHTAGGMLIVNTTDGANVDIKGHTKNSVISPEAFNLATKVKFERSTNTTQDSTSAKWPTGEQFRHGKVDVTVLGHNRDGKIIVRPEQGRAYATDAGRLTAVSGQKRASGYEPVKTSLADRSPTQNPTAQDVVAFAATAGIKPNLGKTPSPWNGPQHINHLLTKVTGSDRLPNVVSPVQLDAIIKGGGKEMFRAVSGYSGTDWSNAEAFRSGPFYNGTGIHGHGTYAAHSTKGNRDHASQEVGMYGNTMLRMALDPKAKVIDEKRADQYMAMEQQKFLADAKTAGMKPAAIDAGRLIYSDVGFWATARGYDAIVAKGGNNGGAYPVDYYVILNRRAVHVDKLTYNSSATSGNTLVSKKQPSGWKRPTDWAANTPKG